MKPFKINRDSWHYKLNKHFFNDYGRFMEHSWEPRHSDFCSYWRATIIRMLVVAILASVTIAFVLMIGVVSYTYPWETLKVIGLFVGVIVGSIGFAYLLVFVGKSKETLDKSLFVQKYRSHKSKVCPMVEYK